MADQSLANIGNFREQVKDQMEAVHTSSVHLKVTERRHPEEL